MDHLVPIAPVFYSFSKCVLTSGAEETFEQDMEKVVRRLKENFVFGAEAEKIRHYIRENRRHSVIASLEARLVETEDKYWATNSAINENFVTIPEEIVRQYPMLLSGCMWGTIKLGYDETIVFNKKNPPLQGHLFHALPGQYDQPGRIHREARGVQFGRVGRYPCQLVRTQSCVMCRREKILYLTRYVPLVETKVNMVELAPRETGKTYLYRNVSYYAHVLSGGKATPAQLFINLNSGQVGMVGTRDVVAWICPNASSMRPLCQQKKGQRVGKTKRGKGSKIMANCRRRWHRLAYRRLRIECYAA